MALNQIHESGGKFEMLDRSFSWTPRHLQQATSLPFFVALVFLALTVLGMEARAEGEPPVWTSSAPSEALLQVARSPSSAIQYEEASKAPGLAGFDAASLPDENQPVSPGLNLDISFEQTGNLEETVADNEDNSARVARIASCYEASVGRYQSEEREVAFTNPLSRTTELDTAMSHFTAQKASRRQFDTCSRF